MNYQKKMKYLLILAVCLFILFSGFNLYYAGYIKDSLSCVSARYHTAVVSPKVLNNTLENYSDGDKTVIPRMALWNRLKKESVQNRFIHRKTDTNVIEVSGDMSLVIPMNFICGNYVYENDDQGCVLDEKTAFQLFGTANAVNNTVIWKGKNYIVRGVAKAKDRMMLLQISDQNYLYSNVEAFYPEDVNRNIADNGALKLKNLLTESGFSEPEAIIDGTELSWLMQFICRLPLWLLGLITAVLLARCSFHTRSSRILRILYGFAALFVFLFLITTFRVNIPCQFIPTKWSDFNFYVNKYKEIKETQQKINDCRLMPKDILGKSYERKILLCTAINLFLLILTKACLRKESDIN